MLLAGPASSLKAKLTEKTRYAPTARIRKLMPAGAGSIVSVPTLGEFVREATEHADALAKYTAAIQKVSRVMGRVQHKEATLNEHDIWRPQA